MPRLSWPRGAEPDAATALRLTAGDKFSTARVDGAAPFAGPPRRDLEEALLDVALDMVLDHRHPEAPDLDGVPRALTRLRWNAALGVVEVHDCVRVGEVHGHDLEPGLGVFPPFPATVPAHLVAAR